MFEQQENLFSADMPEAFQYLIDAKININLIINYKSKPEMASKITDF